MKKSSSSSRERRIGLHAHFDYVYVHDVTLPLFTILLAGNTLEYGCNAENIKHCKNNKK